MKDLDIREWVKIDLLISGNTENDKKIYYENRNSKNMKWTNLREKTFLVLCFHKTSLGFGAKHQQVGLWMTPLREQKVDIHSPCLRNPSNTNSHLLLKIYQPYQSTRTNQDESI